MEKFAGATYSVAFLVWAPKAMSSFVKGYDTLQKSITYIAVLPKAEVNDGAHVCVCVCVSVPLLCFGEVLWGPT